MKNIEVLKKALIVERRKLKVAHEKLAFQQAVCKSYEAMISREEGATDGKS